MTSDLQLALLLVFCPGVFMFGLGFWLGRWFELAGRERTESTPAGVHLVLDSCHPERAVPAANIVHLAAHRSTHPAGPRGGAA